MAESFLTPGGWFELKMMISLLAYAVAMRGCDFRVEFGNIGDFARGYALAYEVNEGLVHLNGV